jgi:hypothetical protein
MRIVVFVLFLACSKAEPTEPPPAPTPTPVPKPEPPPKPAPPKAKLAIARGDVVEIHELTPTGLVQVQSAKLPATAVALEWVGPEPVVMLAATRHRDIRPLWEGWSTDAIGSDPIDGVVGRVTSKGFEVYPRPPDAKWSKLRETKHIGKPFSSWSLHVGADASVWVSHCLFYVSPSQSEGFGCEDSREARLDAPAGNDKKADGPPYRPAPKVAPATTIKITFRPLPDRPEAMQLHCNSPGGNVAYPAKDDPVDKGMDEELRWYANEPPIYASMNQFSGYVTHGPVIVFEGCAVSKSLQNPELEVGFDGLTALYTDDKLFVIWQGRVVAEKPGASVVRFAPPR